MLASFGKKKKEKEREFFGSAGIATVTHCSRGEASEMGPKMKQRRLLFRVKFGLMTSLKQ